MIWVIRLILRAGFLRGKNPGLGLGRNSKHLFLLVLSLEGLPGGLLGPCSGFESVKTEIRFYGSLLALLPCPALACRWSGHRGRQKYRKA
jgi:hypothetical protein